VSHMRASGDYNPRWPKVYDTPFLMQTSMLAWAVGFWPFKDVFESTRKGKINGERSPVLMGLVSATSGGPVAPGDEIGFVNKETVAAVARIDGLLLKPDRPMTATDLTYVRNSTYYVSSTESSHNAFTWYYTLTVNFWPHRIKNKGYFLKDIDILGDFVEYNWFNKEIREVSSDSLISQSLRFEAFIYRVYAPIFPNGIAVVGDPSKYISMADRAFSKCRYSEEDNSIEIVAENALGAKSNLLIYCKTLPTEVIIDGDNIFDVSGKFGDSYTYNPSSKTLVIPLHFAEQSQINLKINP
jgi:hypothetical protein